MSVLLSNEGDELMDDRGVWWVDYLHSERNHKAQHCHTSVPFFVIEREAVSLLFHLQIVLGHDILIVLLVLHQHCGVPLKRHIAPQGSTVSVQ